MTYYPTRWRRPRPARGMEEQVILCATVDDVCWEGEGEGYSSEKHLASLLRFFQELKVRATFTVVPRADGIPLGNRPGYVQLLKQAMAEGHAEIGRAHV